VCRGLCVFVVGVGGVFVWLGGGWVGGGVFRPYGALGAYGGDSDIMGVVAFGVRCVRFVRCVWFVLVCPFTK